MRILVLSDLHLEFAPLRIEPPEIDVVILAGDTAPGPGGLRWAAETFPDATVLSVPGNHEYYGHAIPKLTQRLRERSLELGIHLLDHDALEVSGVRFLGCTLWTDLALFGDTRAAADEILVRMSDVRKIRVSPTFRRFRPTDMIALHGQARRWLEQELEADRDTPTVVITHHAPSARSLEPARRDDLVSAAYASHLDTLVERSGALLWIHGHTHHHVDYRIGDTRVLSNPRGYPDEPVPGFDPGLVVEL